MSVKAERDQGVDRAHGQTGKCKLQELSHRSQRYTNRPLVPAKAGTQRHLITGFPLARE